MLIMVRFVSVESIDAPFGLMAPLGWSFDPLLAGCREFCSGAYQWDWLTEKKGRGLFHAGLTSQTPVWTVLDEVGCKFESICALRPEIGDASWPEMELLMGSKVIAVLALSSQVSKRCRFSQFSSKLILVWFRQELISTRSSEIVALNDAEFHWLL